MMYSDPDDTRDGENLAPEGYVPCEWFVTCPNLTNHAIHHPVLGWVPCCLKCAEHLGIEGERVKITLDQLTDMHKRDVMRVAQDQAKSDWPL